MNGIHISLQFVYNLLLRSFYNERERERERERGEREKREREERQLFRANLPNKNIKTKVDESY